MDTRAAAASGPAAAQWVRDFSATHGRPPAVLHIGNVANNAYLNARILNDAGIDCDVLSDNFYHIMGSPEWEEGHFDASGLDQDLPDWSRVDLGSYRRPAWFAQGPLGLCVRYLAARRASHSVSSWMWWTALTGKRHLSCSARLAPVRALYHQRPGARAADPVSEPATAAPVDQRPAGARDEELIRAFAEAFPDRADRLRPADLVEPARRAASLQPLLRLYDVVHAYAAEPALPLMAGHRPYVAFEHGTLREIPFRQDALGRLTALSYRLADEVIITNGDNRLAAERLGIRRYRFVPHTVSERPPDAAQIERLRRSFREALSADFVVFHPSRQHWDAGFRDPSLEKGNDIFIRGFARFLSDPAVRAGAVFVEWGRKAEESKRLLAACGILDRVRWIAPLPRGPMCDVIEATEVVADQFVLGAFGSITPQALCARRPALLRFDADLHRWCFPEPPPVLNASTPDEVCAQLQRVYRNPGAAREIADAGADWYARFHSNAVVRDRLAGVYRDALANRPPARRPRVA